MHKQRTHVGDTADSDRQREVFRHAELPAQRSDLDEEGHRWRPRRPAGRDLGELLDFPGSDNFGV